MDALRAGDLGADDFRISRETLNQQASTRRAGRLQAACRKPAPRRRIDRHVQPAGLEIYNSCAPAAPPMPSWSAWLSRLENTQSMPLVAAFIREAAEAYRQRGIASRIERGEADTRRKYSDQHLASINYLRRF